LSKPNINSDTPGILSFEWEHEHLAAFVSYIHQHRDGRITGDIRITTTTPGMAPHLHESQFNFSSITMRTALQKRLENRFEDIDWYAILEQVCSYTTDWIRVGEPVIEVRTTDEIEEMQYLLYPILPLNLPTLFFGDGGVGKSHLGMLCGICVQLPFVDNPFSFVTQEHMANVLYLDYEGEEMTFRRTLKRLQQGLELPDLSLFYRYCSRPLADDAYALQEKVSETNAKFIVVDSVGVACGGDLNSAEIALRFFGALRQLKTTSLLIHHTSKDRDTRTKTPFGSTYFSTQARSVWEIKKVQEPGEDKMELGIFHRKTNPSKLFPPIGISFRFEENRIIPHRQDIRTVAEFLQSLSTQTRIYELLKDGAMAIPDIANALDISEGAARVALTRLKEKGQIVKLDKNWGLRSYQAST